MTEEEKKANTPEQVESGFTKRLKEYKREYRRFLRACKKRCNCDRTACSRCLDVEIILNHLRQIQR